MKQPDIWRERLSNERWRSRMSQQELANILGVSKQYLHQMETGARPIPDYRFWQIANVFGMTVEQMFPSVEAK